MLLDKIKLRLRINHDLLNNELTEAIAYARAEMIRVGTPEAVANSTTNVIVNDAIVVYCLSQYANKDMLEKYNLAWEQRLDEIRKTTWPEEPPEAD